MFKKIKLFRGLGLIFALLLAISITAAVIMETYRDPLDAQVGTLSSQTVADENDDIEQWNFKSNFKSAKEAVEGFKAFALKESLETVALLKNSESALPISKTAKVTMMGVRSYAPVYGNSAGSIADYKTVTENQIFKAFADKGLQLNPSMLATYKEFFKDEKWGGSGFGATPPEYSSITQTQEVVELTPDELKALNPDYNKDYASYNEAAIVVVGRPGGESKNYYPGEEGRHRVVKDKDGKVTYDHTTETVTGNILSLSDEEMAVIAEAKKVSDKVIVLVNSTNPMEIANLQDDPDIDAILWIGFPGAYGFYSLVDLLTGVKSPSAHLGDIYAKNTAAAPAMQNFGNIPWANASEFESADNVNSYLVQAEGIYSGYRYYETRYADIMTGKESAAAAKAGTYTNADGTLATTAGTWSYDNEVVYPFGYGLSYTTFEQTLDPNVTISADKKTATVKVTVKNTGDTYAGKSVVQLYAQAPYTAGGLEKSAIQLMDFEKTKELEPGESQTITMNVDMANIASYDSVSAKTFVVDEGDYYFAIGDDSHDALNNILKAQNVSGVTGDAAKTYKWHWAADKTVFSTGKNGVAITNAVSEGDSSMDINTFLPGTATYMSRNDWNGTFPKTYAGLEAKDRLKTLLKNDFIPLKTNDDVSDLKFGAKNGLLLKDLKGADWDDERWDDLVDQVTVAEFLDFASHAFHHIQEIPSVGYVGNNADDGPGGSDTHYFNEGSYQGKPYADAGDYAPASKDDKAYGTRVAPSPTNLAYSWNKELAYENGEIILGETSLVLQLPIIIGPGMNLHRHAYNGRGGEYYSEDPMLSGYIGSAVVQGAQSKGCLVNIKHAAFNDQEINRSGIAVFMNEQRARELELRNLRQAFEANGKPASFVADETKIDTYTMGALGVMTSYNRIGAVASSANKGVMVQVMREEWGFKGYNVTDFTGVSMKAAPKESILYGTTAFCGFGGSVSYFNESSLSGDRDMLLAIKKDIKYILYSLAQSNALNATFHVEWLMTWWRGMYIALIVVTAVLTVAAFAAYVVLEMRNKNKEAV